MKAIINYHGKRYVAGGVFKVETRGMVTHVVQTCPDCEGDGGYGRFYEHLCFRCQGRGWVGFYRYADPNQKDFDHALPEENGPPAA